MFLVKEEMKLRIQSRYRANQIFTFLKFSLGNQFKNKTKLSKSRPTMIY